MSKKIRHLKERTGIDGESLNITEDKINKIKEIIPEAFSEGKIDWEKLKVALGEDIEFKNERYVLVCLWQGICCGKMG